IPSRPCRRMADLGQIARVFPVGEIAASSLRAALIPVFADQGADFIGLNPLHALFTGDPERASPFFPSDRRFLNPLTIAVEAVPGYREAMRRDVFVPTAINEVDYRAAARAKLHILRAIHRRWRANEADIAMADRDAAARHESAGGTPLADFALFEALSNHMAGEGHGAGWTTWPAPYCDKTSPEVAAFKGAHADEIAFHAWLQYVTERQVKAAQDKALAAGMRIGLYLDLAVGAAPDGAATWADPELMMTGVRVGAPPDLFSLDGQDWGLAPLSPTVLQTRAHAPYRSVLDSVMAHAGAVRVDHAMGLERLFFIPEGALAVDGAYVRYEGLTDALVAASRTHRTLAIGEDLGVVPPGFRDRMAARRIFSMKIVGFERDGAGMRLPSSYAADALACLSTHDIAPLEAWWRGDEIDLRYRLGRIDTDTVTAEEAARQEVKARMLELAGLPPKRADDPIDEDIVVAFHRIVGRTRSALAAIRLEDVVGGRRLVNLPGTDREHPNWRNTLPVTVEEICRSTRLERVMGAVREARR
ncbi:MAG: 4-alpha-glucanotransferase, partial [Pseudomonadota bacterium]